MPLGSLLVLCLFARIVFSADQNVLGMVNRFEEELGTAAATRGTADEDPAALLRKHMAFPGAQVCGKWHESYSLLHRRIRAGEPGVPRRYVTMRKLWPGDFGLGDNLNGIVSAFLLGLVTGRALILEDSPITGAVEPAEIDWRLREDVPMVSAPESGRPVVELYLPNGDTGSGINMQDLVRMPTSLLGPNDTLFGNISGAANVILQTNGGILTRVFAERGPTYMLLHSLGLRLRTAFGCILRFILRVRQPVWETVQQPLGGILRARQLQQQRHQFVCLHVRTEDSFAWRPANDSAELLAGYLDTTERVYLGCADAVTDFWSPAGCSVVWVFMSDSKALVDAVKGNHSHEVITSPVPPRHVSIDGESAMASAVADWLLFSACHYYVIANSGFSKAAFAYNPHYPLLFLLSRPGWEDQKQCNDPSNPNSFYDLRSWSGL